MSALSGEKQGPAKNGDFASLLLLFLFSSKHTTERIFFSLWGRLTINEPENLMIFSFFFHLMLYYNK